MDKLSLYFCIIFDMIINLLILILMFKFRKDKKYEVICKYILI